MFLCDFGTSSDSVTYRFSMDGHVGFVCAAAVGVVFAVTGSPVPSYAAEDLVGFTSPSGNIGCMIDSSSVRCDIRERAWSPPPRSDDCVAEMDFGQGIVLDVGAPARFVCAGDTALDGGPPLPYGEMIVRGSLECHSEPAGVSCWDFVYGGSFEISRDSYYVE